MKRFFFAGLLLTAAFTSSCNEENAGTCGGGNNLCFDLDGTTYSMNAEWYQINATRYRILWEESIGADYKNVEIDLYGSLAEGTYTVSESASAPGEAAFQYYLNVGGSADDYSGVSGAINVTSVANNTISGNFTIDVTESFGGTSHSITNGNLDAIPQQ